MRSGSTTPLDRNLRRDPVRANGRDDLTVLDAAQDDAARVDERQRGTDEVA
ncbi:MAG: hypothetical protein JO140_02640 [Candidatus Eremiobacteraeota bacterium]|nr:hypothetical protein [Candidatus Eremiobacteraeota bacterium]